MISSNSNLNFGYLTRIKLRVLQKAILTIIIFCCLINLLGDNEGTPVMLRELTPEEARVIINKETEMPYSGKYYLLNDNGIYACRQCGAELFKSDDKFSSNCGWPSFDDQIPGSVKLLPDTDGQRIEIRCARCGGHLGHIFYGEGFTQKNARYCVNSISLDFKKQEQKEIILGGGCFWCIEAAFQNLSGITKVTSGYAGGNTKNPSYEEVCNGDTGHAEVIKIQYDPDRVNLDKILELFFLVHDPTTLNRQGADAGTQYRSIIIYNDPADKKLIDEYLSKIKDSYNEPIVTEVKTYTNFYEAEDYHKNYYNTHKTQPYCSMVITPKVKKAQDFIDNEEK